MRKTPQKPTQSNTQKDPVKAASTKKVRVRDLATRTSDVKGGARCSCGSIP